MKNKKAILWDNDGVLVDTEKYFYKAAKEVLKKVDFDFTREMYIEWTLIKAIGPWHILEERHFDKETIEKLKKERDNLYKHYLMTEDILIHDVRDIVRELAEKYKMAIVTSSKPEHFRAIHKRTDLLHFFDFAITCEDYTHFKPHPEPYLTALQKIGCAKEDCIVIEDTRRGLLSARAAELDCIIITNELTRTSDFKEAGIVLDNITALRDILL